MFRDNKNVFKTLGIIAVTILFIWAIFNPSGPSDQEKQATDGQEANAVDNKSEAAENISDSQSYTLPEAYEDEQIVFKIVGYSESASQITLKLYFENNSDDMMAFSTQSVRVNDVTLGGSFIDNNEWLFGDIAFSKDLAAHKKANVELYVEKKDLKKHGIESVGQIGLISYATNQETYKTTNIPYMAVELSDGGETAAKPIKATVYEDSKVRVEYIGLADKSFKFRLHNSMEQTFLFILRDVNINDFGYGDIYSGSEHVYPTTYYDFSVEAPSEFCKVNGIEKLEKIDFSIEIIPVVDRYKNSFSVEIEAVE